jgi:hypothetical protein
MKVAVPHHSGAAEHRSIERAIHVLNRQPEMLGSLQTTTQRPIVVVGGLRRRPSALAGDAGESANAAMPDNAAAPAAQMTSRRWRLIGSPPSSARVFMRLGSA